MRVDNRQVASAALGERNEWYNFSNKLSLPCTGGSLRRSFEGMKKLTIFPRHSLHAVLFIQARGEHA